MWSAEVPSQSHVGASAEHALRNLRREILDMGGAAILLATDALVGGGEIEALFQRARDAEYAEILDKCNDFHAGVEKEYAAEHFTHGELEENEVELVELRSWMLKASLALTACDEASESYAARVYQGDGDEA